MLNNKTTSILGKCISLDKDKREKRKEKKVPLSIKSQPSKEASIKEYPWEMESPRTVPGDVARA